MGRFFPNVGTLGGLGGLVSIVTWRTLYILLVISVMDCTRLNALRVTSHMSRGP